VRSATGIDADRRAPTKAGPITELALLAHESNFYIRRETIGDSDMIRRGSPPSPRSGGADAGTSAPPP
jgi:hypothetical protein